MDGGVLGVLKRVTIKGLVQPIPPISKGSLKNTAVTASLCMSSALAKCLTALSLLASLLLLKKLPRKHPSVVVLGVSR